MKNQMRVISTFVIYTTVCCLIHSAEVGVEAGKCSYIKLANASRCKCKCRRVVISAAGQPDISVQSSYRTESFQFVSCK